MSSIPALARRACLALLALGAVAPAWSAGSPAKTDDTYTRSEVVREAEKMFGKGAQGMAEAIGKAFKDYGEPTAIIKGEEAGGAIGVGVRYGKGQLVTKGGAARTVYWQGPSVGFDIGGNAAKCFTLVYHLHDPSQLFQRFPGVEGSLYFVGGFSVNYNRSDDIVLAPVRLGVGWRQGASIGYLHFTPKKEFLPL